MMREETVLLRDVEVTAIPYGDRITLHQRQPGDHQPGPGRLVHAGDHAGLHGPPRRRRTPTPSARSRRRGPSAEEAKSKTVDQMVWDQLRTCYDPEIPVNIVELGLVHSAEVEAAADDGGQKVEVRFTLTAPGCGMGDVLQAGHRAQGADHPRGEGGRRAGAARPALGPDQDVRRRAPAAGADVRSCTHARRSTACAACCGSGASREGGSLTIAELSRQEGISAAQRGQDDARPAPGRPRTQHARQGRRLHAGPSRRADPRRRGPGRAGRTALRRRLLRAPLRERAACAPTWRDCSIRSVWRMLQDAIDGVLGRMTLKDLLRSESDMRACVARPQVRDSCSDVSRRQPIRG